MLRRGVGFWCVAAAISGCTGDRDVFLEATWPDDHAAIVVVLDQYGEPLASPTIYAPGAAIRPAFNRFQPFTVHVRTYAPDRMAPNGAPMTECGVGVGAGQPLPRPSSAWFTPLVELDDTAAIAFREEQLDALDELDVHLVGCAPINRACDDYRVERIDLDPAYKPVRIVALDDDGAIVALRSMTATIAHRFARVSGTDVTMLPVQPHHNRFVRDMSWDYAGTLFLRDEDGNLFAMDEAGEEVSLPPDLVFANVVTGTDGTVMAFDIQHTVEIHVDRGEIVERPDVPFGLKGLTIQHADRILARTPKTIYSFDGRVWAQEYAAEVLETFRDLVVTDDLMAAVGTVELVRVRDPATGDWKQVERPFDAGADLDRAAALSAGRFVTIGNRGRLIAWTGSDWCDLSLGTDFSTNDIDSAGATNITWASVNSVDQTASFALRIHAPAL